MPYDPPSSSAGGGGRTRSASESSVLRSQRNLSWCSYLKMLLLQKATLVYITMAETTFNVEKFGHTLKCIKRAINCYSMVESIGGKERGATNARVISFALGVAGDSYMAAARGGGDE